MRRKTALLASLFALLAAGSAAAGAPEAAPPHVLKIWDNASAPHSNGIATPETAPGEGLVGNTSEAVLYIYPADTTRDRRRAVVICPGGGYACLAMEHEGHAVARWLASEGVTAAVLKYRLPEGHPEVPLEDAVQALRIMQGLEAGATGYAPGQVGIAGFSAGGHLAAAVSTLGGTRPAFSILFYPVISGDKGLAHEGSFDRLLGAERTPGQTARYSLERQVDAATPPALLLLSDDDRGVPPANSLRYYEALKARGIAASMHVYPSGGHGWGCREGFRYKAAWQQALLDWLDTLPRAEAPEPR